MIIKALEHVNKRTIISLDDGTYYSDLVTIEFQDVNGDKLIFYCHPDSLFDIVKNGITSMAQVKEGDVSEMTEEQATLKKQVVRIMRAAVKALFVTSGDMILTLFLGKGHERPPKVKKGETFDIIDWYMDMFAKIGISYAMKNDTILKGQFAREEGSECVYTVNEVYTRPVTPDEGTTTEV
jgi:hypothetical protein